MNKTLFKPAQRLVLPLCLLFPLLCTAEQFVELTAEIDLTDWDWRFMSDQRNLPGSPSIFHASTVFHCVVGTNTWLVECGHGNGKTSYWFTGTNIIEQTVAPNRKPFTVVAASVDGNPGQPVRVADLMTFNATARICWLAFCSGPFLKRDGRQIFPPGDLWKESRLVDSGWSDKTTVFNDGLGLPKSINLVTANNQSIFQYQAHQSTNVLGWNFPLEFYGVQYLPTDTNGWKLHLTVKGKVTAIGVGADPRVPAEIAVEMGGTGVWIVDRRKDDEPLRTGNVFPKSPADKAGIKSDWFLISVDGTNVVSMPATNAASMIRGPAGTVVTLELAGPTRSKTNTFTLKRGKVTIENNSVVEITDQ